MDELYPSLLRRSQVFGEYHVMMAKTRADHKCVVFFDLCGSVQCRQDRGPHAAFVQIEQFRYLVEHWVGKHDGTIVKHTGDGMMAVFANIQDAQQCARDLIGTVESSVGGPCRLPCKIGIAYGGLNEIRFNDGGGRPSGQTPMVDYVGTPADLAARLVNIAMPNQVLIDDVVYQATAGAAGLFDRSPTPVEVDLKGFAHPQKVSELLWGNRPAQHVDPGAYAVPVIKIDSLKGVLGRAIDLLENALRDIQEVQPSGALPTDHLLTYVDFPAYGSFSAPDECEVYRGLLLKIAASGNLQIAVLSPKIAELSSKLQFGPLEYASLLRAKRTAVEAYTGQSEPSYDDFVKTLLFKDASFVNELVACGVTAVEQDADPRVHVWIRGLSEAVVSFVFIKSGNGRQEWSETGFYTSSKDLVAILRDYIKTLLSKPL